MTGAVRKRARASSLPSLVACKFGRPSLVIGSSAQSRKYYRLRELVTGGSQDLCRTGDLGWDCSIHVQHAHLRLVLDFENCVNKYAVA